MVAVPLGVSDMRKTSLYPTAVSEAYAFVQGQGYVLRDTLNNGIGYWLRFDTTGTVSITGTPIICDTIDVEPGWSLVGGISGAVDTASVVQVPPRILISPYYSYNGGYTPTDSLRPGVAYWVKSNETGKLILAIGVNMTNEPSGTLGKRSSGRGETAKSRRGESNR